MNQRTGVSDDDLEEFERKAQETADLIKALKEGKIAPSEVRIPGEKTEEELREEEDARSRREEERRREALQRKQAERVDWWNRAQALRQKSREDFLKARHIELTAIVKGNKTLIDKKRGASKSLLSTNPENEVTITDDDGTVLFPRPKQQGDSLDYSKWDRWIPDDPVSLEEMQRAKDQIEEERNRQFEAANPEFCNQFKRDQAKRIASRDEKSRSAEKYRRQQGNMHFLKKNFDAALRSYGCALQSVPWSLSVLCNIAQVYLVQGALDDALEYCERALFIDDTNVKALWRHSRVCILNCKLEQAVQDLTMAELLQPNDREIARALIDCREQLMESYTEDRVSRFEAEAEALSQKLAPGDFLSDLEEILSQKEPDMRIVKEMCKAIHTIDPKLMNLRDHQKLALNGMLECTLDSASRTLQAESHVLLRTTGTLNHLFEVATSSIVADPRPYHLLARTVLRNKTNRDTMHGQHIIEILYEKIACESEKEKEPYSIYLLHALSEDEELAASVLPIPGLYKVLERCLQNVNSRIFSSAALLVANIAALPPLRQELVQSPFAEKLADTLYKSLFVDRAAAQDASVALANLAQDQTFRKMLDSDGIARLTFQGGTMHFPEDITGSLLALLLNLTANTGIASQVLTDDKVCQTLTKWFLDSEKQSIIRLRSMALLSRVLSHDSVSTPRARVLLQNNSKLLIQIGKLAESSAFSDHSIRLLAVLLKPDLLLGMHECSKYEEQMEVVSILTSILQQEVHKISQGQPGQIRRTINLAQCFVQLSNQTSFCQEALVRETTIPNLILLLQFCDDRLVRKNVAISLAKLAKASQDNLDKIRSLNGMRMLVELGGDLTA
eukprot:CAMPEP_0171574796 /NCGR_PEP_ID=MMETSP0961-20121227/5585_1 /TAXON_ID=87120 /ORGANISM="Aurantiochytrium limacinum, Strain ATCCMYA-1381" /LENGTH=845 /DNA_ID=CAMNT_0012130209 /DNA_START=243 /DNA_END=2781 /DNA_ORIENTATION=-